MNLEIQGRKIGNAFPPFVIAEIGINHGGNLQVAKQMALAAFNAGAECVKHQTHFVEDEMTAHAKSIIPGNCDESIYSVIESCALSPDEEYELKKYVEDLGMIYLSTPFSRKAADFLSDIGVNAFKIGSGECDSLPLIRHIIKLGKPIIMSTGMQSIASIRPSVNLLMNSGLEFALLECTNIYPSPPEAVSLLGITELKDNYAGVPIGFSDHSIGPYMALGAVALGACIIERHFTDSRYRIGPDISASMDPAELRLLIDRSRELWMAANNSKSRSAGEEATYQFARSSVVAIRDLEIGTKLSEDDIWVRRPGTGEIPGYEFDEMIGKVLKFPVKNGSQLRRSDFE